MNRREDIAIEIDALRRMGEFDVFGGRIASIDQLERGFALELDAGKLVIYVDCYDPPVGQPWDVDAWEQCKLLLEVGEPIGREAWRKAYGVARALVNGRPVAIAEGRIITRAAWAWEVRHAYH